jgi:hypothetical protein
MAGPPDTKMAPSNTASKNTEDFMGGLSRTAPYRRRDHAPMGGWHRWGLSKRKKRKKQIALLQNSEKVAKNLEIKGGRTA